MTDNVGDVVREFRNTRCRAYPVEHSLVPPWDDGSVAAAISAVLDLEAMIGNGGWPAVYYNQVGWLVPIAANGYRLLGMDACAARCERAADLVLKAEAMDPGADHVSETWFSSTLMERVGEASWDALDDGWLELTVETWERAADMIKRMV